MENGPFTDDFPNKTSIYNGFSIAMLNYQRVIAMKPGYSQPLWPPPLRPVFASLQVARSPGTALRTSSASEAVQRRGCTWEIFHVYIYIYTYTLYIYRYIMVKQIIIYIYMEDRDMVYNVYISNKLK